MVHPFSLLGLFGSRLFSDTDVQVFFSDINHGIKGFTSEFFVLKLLLSGFELILQLLNFLFIRRYKQQTIFISGSAEEYGNWKRDESLSFVHNLSKALIKEEYRIVNGFGWGIGSAVINGALETIYEKPNKYSEDQLILRPFPQFKTGKTELPDLWHEYRERMIRFAGVSIFIFGNKMGDNSIVNAGGIRKEFDIAKENGNALIPIGATGYMAAELHKEVLSNFKSFYPNHSTVKPHIEMLGDSNSKTSDLIKGITEILKIIRK